MLSRSFALALLCSAFSFVAVASPESAFDWIFADNLPSTELPECGVMSISTTVMNNTSSYTGTPPFFFTAYEMEGIPTMQVLKPDKNGNMNWTVDHPAGSRIALSMWDSEGKSGGVAHVLYQVTAGSSDHCFPAPPDNPPRIMANVTSPNLIGTCEPWGLNVTGGLSPYTVTLLALDQRTQINMTLAPQDNVLTFINRASPGSTLIAAVLDANGDFGTNTLFVGTTGSNNTSCTGAVSHASAPLPQTSASLPHMSARSKHARTLAIALSVTFALLFVIAAILYIHIRRRRRQHLGLAHAPDSDKSTDNDRWFRSIVTPAILRRPTSAQAHAGTGPRKAMPPQRMAPPLDLAQARTGSPGDMSEIKRLRPQASRLDAQSLPPPVGTRRSSQDSTAPLVRRPLSAVDEVYQHEDAEDAVVRNELPPPYRTR